MSGAIPPHSHKPPRWVTPLVVELARGNLGSNLTSRLPRKPKRAKELPPQAKLMLMHAVCELLVRNSTFVETDRTAGWVPGRGACGAGRRSSKNAAKKPRPAPN
jgi:hypothetical protein